MNNSDRNLPKASQSTIIEHGVRIKGGFNSTNTIINKGNIVGDVIGTDGYIANNNSVLNGPLTAKWVDLQHGLVDGDVTADEQVSLDRRALIKGTIKANSLNQEGLVRGKMVIHDFAILSRNSKTFGNLTSQYVNIEPGARINGYFNINGGQVDDRLRESVSNMSDTLELAQRVSIKDGIDTSEKHQPAALKVSKAEIPIHSVKMSHTAELPKMNTKQQDLFSEPISTLQSAPRQEVVPQEVKHEVVDSKVKVTNEMIKPKLKEKNEIVEPEVVEDPIENVEAIGNFIKQSNNLINVAIIILMMLFVVLVVMVTAKYIF